MIKNFIRFVLIGAALALLLMVVTGGFFLGTSAGKTQLASIMETQLANATGGPVRVGRLDGALPGAVILRDLEFQNDEGIWLSVARVDLKWRPFALLGRAVEVDRLAVSGVRLLDTPPTRAAPAQPTTEAPASITFPTSFPKVLVRTMMIDDVFIAEKFAGISAQISANGRLAMGGRRFDMAFDARNRDNADVITLTGALDQATGRLSIDAAIESDAADGMIAALSNADGSVAINANGVAPLNDYALTATGQFGAYGDANLTISGDLEKLSVISIEGGFVHGAKLADLAERLGPRVDVKTQIRSHDDGIDIAVASLAARAVSMTGDVTIRNDQKGLARIGATTNIAVHNPDASEPFNAIVQYLGDAISIEGVMARNGDAFKIDGAVQADKASLRVDNAVSDLREMFEGRVLLNGQANDTLPPPLKTGYQAAVDITLAGDSARLSDLDAKFSDAAITGDANLNGTTSNFAFDGVVRAGPTTIAALIPDAETTSSAIFDLSVNGVPDRFSLTVDGAAPAITIQGVTTAPLDMKIDFTGLPATPNGAATANARDGSTQFTLNLATLADQIIKLSDLSYTGEGFDLSGEGRFAPSNNTGALTLAYRGDAGAAPWPGVGLSGVMDADVSVTDDGSGAAPIVKAVLTAPALAAPSVILDDVSVNIDGPMDAARAAISAQSIDAAGAPYINNLSVDGILHVKDTISVDLTNFRGVIDAVAMTLKKPSRIDFSDGVRVDDLALGVGANGLLTADARFSPQKWALNAIADRVVLPQGAAVVTGQIKLDTDNPTIADGRFDIQSVTLDDATEDLPSLSAALNWSGDNIRITHADPDGPLKADIRIPAQLVRGDTLSVATDGPLSGDIKYDGRIEQLIGLLPAPLQSMEGAIALNATIAGVIAAPEIDGALTISDGAYTEPASGLSLVNITLNTTATSSAAGTRAEFTGGAAGPGQDTQTILLTGGAAIQETTELDVQLTLDDARISGGPVTRLITTGDLRLSGNTEKMTAVGDITIDGLEIQAAPTPSTGLVALEVVDATGEISGAPQALVEQKPNPAAQSPLDLDIKITAPGKMFVRGFGGLESEWKADMQVTGDAANPLILGDIEIVRGAIDFSGQRFDLSTGLIDFDRLTPNNPTLNLQADYEARNTATGDDVTASIVIGGRAQSPTVALESTPSLPQDDIMALVLFGKPASQLKALETVKLANALAQVGGVGPFGGGGGGVVGGARSAIGLDSLNVDFDGTGNTTLSAGKYVADGLFVSASQSAKGDAGSVRVEYELTNSISVETELRQDGDQTVSANWKRDF